MKSFAIIGTIMALFAAGCGGARGPELVPAGGTVTYNGNPVPNADIAFAPENAPAAVGKTDEQGRFSLKTGAEDGAVPGMHKVSISAIEAGSKGPDPATLPDPNTDPEGYSLAMEEYMSSHPQQAPKWLIPQKYGRTLTSGLSYEVKQGETNQFEIKLSD